MASTHFPEAGGGIAVASVSEFVLQLRVLIERNCPLGWVGGEISNLVHAASGHVYFSLRDERSQIRCAMWRNRAQLLPFRLAEGMRVEVRAQATIYEARGELQLSVESVRRAGIGSLYEAFLRLKAKLEAEGLFETARKRPLPARPAGIALVTSASGAALHDVLTVLRRRAPGLPITLYPSLVQGEAAPAALVAAIRRAGERAAADGNALLLLCRGGGSLEDLWAFNAEALVRAIAACPIPVVTGIGHETDTSLADFAADLRAPTPSAAAELVSAGWYMLRQQLPQLGHALDRALERRLERASQRLDDLQRRLIHPQARLNRSRERIDELERRLRGAIRSRLREAAIRHQALAARLRAQRPEIASARELKNRLDISLRRAMQRRLGDAALRLQHAEARLTALDPHAILARGYAIVMNGDGVVLRDPHAAGSGERISIRLAGGAMTARVEGAESPDS